MHPDRHPGSQLLEANAADAHDHGAVPGRFESIDIPASRDHPHDTELGEDECASPELLHPADGDT
eukprot:4952465-Pyramimonas_sp.AAC.1